MCAKPILIRNYLNAPHTVAHLVILHEGRAFSPQPALHALIGSFMDDGKGGFVGAGQSDEGGFGYIDGQGRWLVAPTLQDAKSFSNDGLARFQRDDKWGYLDLQGNVVIAAQFTDALAFSGGLAPVQAGTHWRYIDRSGSFAFDGEFLIAKAFGPSGLAVASRSLAEGFGYIDASGRWRIAPQFARTSSFTRHGVAPASLDGKHYGLIDTSGNWIMKPRAWNISQFNDDGYAYYYELDDLWDGNGYLDTSGRAVIQHQQRLARYMMAGWANRADIAYIGPQGELETSADISWGGHFNEHGFAVVRSIAPRADDPRRREAHWGILGADGTFVPAPAGVLEPLTDSEGSIRWPEPDTPLVAFHAVDGNVALLDRNGAVAYRLERETVGEGECAVLRDAAGLELWRSEAASDLSRTWPFFDMAPEAFLIGMDSYEDLGGVVETMIAETEKKLHGLAAGEFESEDGDNEDGEDDDYGNDDDNSDPALTAANQVRTSLRIFRAYLDEATWGTYEFLGDERLELRDRARSELIARLVNAFGPADPDPDYAGAAAGRNTLAWSVQLKQPVPGAAHLRAESRQLWMGLTSDSDSGDGDCWHQIWLYCAPSKETLEAAMMAAPQVSAGIDEDEDEDGDQDQDADHDEDQERGYDEWLAYVGESDYHIEQVPPEMLDDAMADAAVQANVRAYERLPPAFQTPARLEAIIRSGVERARRVPASCMTAEGLALARSLYADLGEWHYTDEERSRQPERPLDQNSLYDVWGCLVDEQLASDALVAGVTLDNVPLWLRSEQLDAKAVEADIRNIRYIDKNKITPELAARAVLVSYADLIEDIPEAMLTPALCLASVQVCGTSLEFVPSQFCTAEVCAAAMRQSSNAFVYVPAELEEEVCTILIDEEQAAAVVSEDTLPGTHWHGFRAWSRLWREDYHGAIADATLGLDHVDYPVHMHYVLARAYEAIGDMVNAALAAANLLAIHDTYETQFNRDDQTAWLKHLAGTAMRAAPVEILLEQLAIHPNTLSQIPQSRISEQMVQVAIEADPSAVKFVPKRLMTSTLYAIALQHGSKDARQIPEHLWTEDLAMLAVELNGYNLDKVPHALRTPAVCRAAIAKNGGARSYVPDVHFI